MGLNNNKERQVWWQEMQRRYTAQEIAQAIATLKPDTQTVIRLHYEQRLPLKDITGILHRSMTIVRSHQCMGIYKLWQYFHEAEKRQQG